jgi:hypothetical protein
MYSILWASSTPSIIFSFLLHHPPFLPIWRVSLCCLQTYTCSVLQVSLRKLLKDLPVSMPPSPEILFIFQFFNLISFG